MDSRDKDVSALFRALAEPRRRIALEALCEHGSMTLADLAEVVAERERGERVESISPQRVTQIYFSLYHSHIPELEDSGLVRYEQEGDLVALREASYDALGRARDELDDIVSD